MIRLDTAFITAVTSVFNGVTSTTTTDTLRVSYAELDLIGGNVMAMVERGYVTPAVTASAEGVTPVVAAAPATFVATLPKLRIQLSADGKFSSTDGSWAGTIDPAVSAGFVASLRAGFEAFVLGSGAVTGTTV